MKKYLLILIGMIAAFSQTSSAKIIVLQGGTKDHHYEYVYDGPERTICKRRGNNPCLCSGCEGNVFRTVQFNDIVTFVLEKFDKGETKGDTKFEDEFPVNWQVNTDGELVININEDGFKRGK